MDVNELFKNFLEEIEQVVSLNVYNLWFSKIRPISLEGNTLKIVVPMDIHKSMLSENYKEYIDKAFINITGKTFNIEYFTEDELQETKENKPNKEVTEDLNEEWVTNLNPKFTFESFVVGESNRLAVVSAHAVAENPGSIHNPLFLYGRSGIGKTHLMHAIGNYIVNHSNKKVLYVTSNEFVEDYTGIASIEKGISSMNYAKNFKDKYKNVDVLIIDDIQFLVGADKSQQEFFHTFNALHENGCQIIMSSDKPPKDMDNLEDRLKSRFEWGLIADISNADYETRLAILRKKVQLESIIIDDNILSNIAIKVDSNIRELEGTLNKILAKASLTHSPISIELAEQCINEVISKKEKVISANYIQEVVAKYFNITQKDIKSSKRSNDIAYPRQIAMYLCRDIANMPFTKIGDAFGKRDHTTVMHACSKIDSEVKENNNTKLIVDSVKKLILDKE